MARSIRIFVTVFVTMMLMVFGPMGAYWLWQNRQAEVGSVKITETEKGQSTQKPLLFKTAWSVVFADVYGGRRPVASRQLWPAESPDATALAATRYVKPVPARFEMWAVRRDASILEIMEVATKDGYFIADPHQVKQFVEKSAIPGSVWPLERESHRNTVAVSRYFRYYGCRGWEKPQNFECIPPAVFFYKGSGEWAEMNQSADWVKKPIVPAHTHVLLMKVLPGTLRHYGI